MNERHQTSEDYMVKACMAGFSALTMIALVGFFFGVAAGVLTAIAVFSGLAWATFLDARDITLLKEAQRGRR